MAENPPFGVPGGEIKVENPDGVFRKDGGHSAYDSNSRFNNPIFDFNIRRAPAQGGQDPSE